MDRPLSRRDIFRAGGVLAGGALVAGALPIRSATALASQPAAVAPAAGPPFTVMTAATKVAARTDRRPVAGGVFDPTAGKTFICWGGKNEDTYVQSYDHVTHAWSKPAKVMSGGGDSHNYPTMVQAADGRILIFVGTHNDQLVMARSAQAHAITGTWTTKAVKEGPAASYPMPFKTANGDLFVFYRETSEEISSAPADTRPMLYVKSTDNGVTWKSSRTLTGKPFALGSTKRSDHLNEVYIGQLRLEPATDGRPERVHLVWTIAGGGSKKHTHDAYHKDIYYATFDPATLRFRSVTGADLGTQLDDGEYDKTRVLTTAVTNPGGAKSPDYIQLVGWLPDGRPFLMWMTSDSKALLHNTAAVWTGSAWQTREVATGLRTREAEQVGPTTWRIYTTVDEQPNIGTYLLEAGQTWTAENVLKTPKPVQRIEVVTNFRDPARILATGNSSARSVSTADGDIYVAGLAVPS